MLPACNSDYLYTLQDNSIFIQGVTFMQDIVNHHGGWVTESVDTYNRVCARMAQSTVT